MKKLNIILIALLLFTSTFCFTANKKGTNIVYIGYSLEKPFWNALSKKLKTYSRIHGLDLIDLTPALNKHSQGQAELMEYALNKNTDAIIIGLGSPLDEKEITKTFDKFYAEGIPIILIDTYFSHPGVLAYITSDNLFGGKLAGQHIASKIKNNKTPSVLILGGEKKHPNSILRIKGIQEICEDENIDYSIVYADWSNEKAYEISKELLTENTDFDAVFSCWDPGIIVAEAVYKSTRGKKDLIFVGFDGLPQTFDLIKTNHINATIAQNSNKMAEKTILITKKILAKSHYRIKTLIDPVLADKEFLLKNEL